MEYIWTYKKEVVIVMFVKKHSEISKNENSTITFLRVKSR